MFTDKIANYTGVQFDSFTIDLAKRSRRKVAVITIGRADLPLMFEKPGAYTNEHGESKTAFGAGTLYLRHGAKSEPARSADIAHLIERNVQRARKEWLTGVRQVTNAPRGSTISVLPPKIAQSNDAAATPIRITDNPGAPEYQLIDPDKTHPWRQKELLDELNRPLPTKINPYDLLAVRRLHGIDEDPAFVHKPRFGSTQYSPNFAKWLLEQHSNNPRFFEKCRSAFKPTADVHVVNDERLRWLSDLMQADSISISRMARRLKIGGSTLSRLMAGKYTADVPRMLERIETYQRSIGQTT